MLEFIMLSYTGLVIQSFDCHHLIIYHLGIPWDIVARGSVILLITFCFPSSQLCDRIWRGWNLKLKFILFWFTSVFILLVTVFCTRAKKWLLNPVLWHFYNSMFCNFCLCSHTSDVCHINFQHLSPSSSSSMKPCG